MPKKSKLAPVTLKTGLPDTYVLSDGEIDNIVYLVCKYTCGWNARSADVQICKMMAARDGTLQGQAGVQSLLETTCEYVWDHICGEPDDASAEKFVEHMTPILNEWYAKTTPAERSKTE